MLNEVLKKIKWIWRPQTLVPDVDFVVFVKTHCQACWICQWIVLLECPASAFKAFFAQKKKKSPNILQNVYIIHAKETSSRKQQQT